MDTESAAPMANANSDLRKWILLGYPGSLFVWDRLLFSFWRALHLAIGPFRTQLLGNEWPIAVRRSLDVLQEYLRDGNSRQTRSAS
jgi:hypothetical protein